MVVPSGIIPFDHYNDWYYDLIQPNIILNTEIKQTIKEEIKNDSTDLDRIKTVFDLVKNRIHYIAIENGIGAVMPRPVNQTWLNRQGDCKDMSALLYAALQSIGYDAKLALSATIGHSFDLDFSSLASANHAICVVDFGGKRYYLDATEDAGFFDYPSRQIQGKNILIIDDKEGQLVNVPKISAKQNKVIHQLHYQKKGNGLIGTVENKYFGLSQIPFRDAQKKIGKERLQNRLEKHLNIGATNLNYQDINLSLLDSTCQINAALYTERNFTTINKKTYLSLAFLPYPHRQEVGKKVLEKEFYDTQYHQYNIEINLGQPIQSKKFKPIHLSEMGIEFHFSITQPTDQIIKVSYQYINDNLLLKDESLVAFRKIDLLIQQVFNKSIIYEIDH